MKFGCILKMEYEILWVVSILHFSACIGYSSVVIRLILYDQLIRLWRYTIKNMLSINVAVD